MTSFTENIASILTAVKDLCPKRILDVGPGFGKFGILIREMVLSDRAEKGEMLPVDNLVIDCAEEAKYFQELPYHLKLYNNHWHDDVMKMPTELLNSYDLLLLIDVVEHWDKEVAKNWLGKITTSVLISTPRRVHMFKERYYNARNHVSQWSDEDFKGKDYSTEGSFIYLEKNNN